MSRTVVVLGAGVGGLTAATELRTLLAPTDRVVLVDRSFTGSLGLSALSVLRGRRTPAEVQVKPNAAALPGISMVTGEVEAIDTAAKTVQLGSGETIAYDALVIALGASLNPNAVPGLAEALDSGVAGQFYTPDDAADLHRRIESTESGRIMVLIAAVPFKCPAAPFEAAFLIADQLGEKFTDRRVRVDAFTPDPLPMPVAGPAVGKALVEMLETRGIGFHSGKSVVGVDSDGRTVEFADGSREPFDLLAVVPPHRPVPAVAASGLGPNGWIPVDAATSATSVDGVWAVGDTTVLTLPNGKPLPKAAIFARAEAEVAANGVARYLGSDVAGTRFTGDGACYVEIGGGLAAKGSGNFLNPPAPAVTLHEPSPQFHAEKVTEERDWIARWNVSS